MTTGAKESRVSGALKWTGGIVSGVLVSAVVAWCGIGEESPTGLTIEGPSTVRYGTIFTLSGHVNGEYNSAYWTDTVGQQIPLRGYENLQFYCPGIGEYHVFLTSVDADGTRESTKHDVTCSY
jgi:hypothetical protein